jgi:hypothetical protein
MHHNIFQLEGNLNSVLNLNNPASRQHSGSVSTTASTLIGTAGCNGSDSELETDQSVLAGHHHHHHQHLRQRHHHHHHSQRKANNKQLELFKRNTNTNLIQPTKRITNKLISFLRKLRNEADGEIEEEEEEEEDDERENIDVDDLDIDQISDFSDTELDDSNLDLYSIISNPKPSIQPFFKKSKEDDDGKTNENDPSDPMTNEPNPMIMFNYDEDFDQNDRPYNLLEDSIDNL